VESWLAAGLTDRVWTVEDVVGVMDPATTRIGWAGAVFSRRGVQALQRRSP
jgi:hypothetical protein